MIKIVSKNLIREDKVDEFKSLMKELVEKSSACIFCSGCQTEKSYHGK